MAGVDDFLLKLAAIGKVDPNALPDYGFGPMTPDTIAGRKAEIRATPNPGEHLQAIANMGAGPQLARGEAGLINDATDAIGKLNDPSLGNLTNAGVRTGLALASPTIAGASAVGGLSLAALKDLNLIPSAEAKKAPKLKGPVYEDKAAPPPVAPDAMAAAVKDDPHLSLLYNAYKDALSRSTDDVGGPRVPGASGDKARAALAEQAKSIMGEITAELDRRDQAKRDQQKGVFDKQVAEAEAARDAEKAQDTKFSDTNTGKVFQSMGGFAPLAMGLIPGSIMRMARGPATTGVELLKRAGLGSLGGAAANNIPLAYDAFMTPPENPEQKADQAYAFNLPEGHPEKAKYQDRADLLAQTQPGNPRRELAAKELYDPVKFGERSIMGGIEGGLGADIGGDIPGFLGGFGRRSSVQLPAQAEQTIAARLAGKPPAMADRIEPTLSMGDGAFADTGPAWSNAKQPTLGPQVGPTKSAADILDKAKPSVPTPVKPPTASGIIATPAATLDKASKVVAKEEAAKRLVQATSLARELKITNPKMTVPQLRKLIIDNGFTDPAEATRHLTRLRLQAAQAPDATQNALDDLFKGRGK